MNGPYQQIWGPNTTVTQGVKWVFPFTLNAW